MPRPTLAQLLIGGTIIAIAASLVAIPTVLREMMRSRAEALGGRIERAVGKLEASPRRRPPPPCVGPEPDAWRLPSALRQKLRRYAVPARVSRSLEAALPAGRTPGRATLAYAANLELDEVAWSAMACGRGEEPPFDYDLELLFMLRFAERLTAGSAACLQGAGEIVHAGHAQAAWADEWGNDSQPYRIGIEPAKWLTAGVLRCASEAPSDVVASLAHELVTDGGPPPPPRLIGLWRYGQAHSYVTRILRDLDTYWYFPLTSDPEHFFEEGERHVAVIELGARIRADDLPTVVAALNDPALGDGQGSIGLGLIKRYLDALVRHRMLALALFAIAGGSFEERLRDPRLADPLTGQPFDWDGEQLTTPGIRLADSGGIEPISLHVPR